MQTHSFSVPVSSIKAKLTSVSKVKILTHDSNEPSHII